MKTSSWLTREPVKDSQSTTKALRDKLVAVGPRRVTGSDYSYHPRDAFRLSFGKEQTKYHNIRAGKGFIGKSIALKLGLKHKDRIQLFHLEGDPYSLYITKSESTAGTYTVKEVKLENGGYGEYLQFYCSWALFRISDRNRTLRVVKHEIVEDAGEKFLKLDMSVYKESPGLEVNDTV